LSRSLDKAGTMPRNAQSVCEAPMSMDGQSAPVCDVDDASRVVAQALAMWGQCLSLCWQTAFAWPRACAAVQGQLWDTWVAHWGGGVPLDG